MVKKNILALALFFLLPLTLVTAGTSGISSEDLIGLLTGAASVDGSANSLKWIPGVVKGALLIAALYLIISGLGLTSSNNDPKPINILWGVTASIISLKWNAVITWLVNNLLGTSA